MLRKIVAAHFPISNGYILCAHTHTLPKHAWLVRITKLTSLSLFLNRHKSVEVCVRECAELTYYNHSRILTTYHIPYYLPSPYYKPILSKSLAAYINQTTTKLLFIVGYQR